MTLLPNSFFATGIIMLLHFHSIGGAEVCSVSNCLREVLPFLINGEGRAEQQLKCAVIRGPEH